ncbi:MAG: hypothetical protein ACLP2F_03635 [Steroidobacteraceae bacterium]
MLPTQELFDIQQASRDSRGNLTLPARTIRWRRVIQATAVSHAERIRLDDFT